MAGETLGEDDENGMTQRVDDDDLPESRLSGTSSESGRCAQPAGGGAEVGTRRCTIIGGLSSCICALGVPFTGDTLAKELGAVSGAGTMTVEEPAGKL